MNKEALFNKIMDILHLDLIKKNPPKTIDDWKKIEDKEYLHTRKLLAPDITNKKLLHYVAINDPSEEVALKALENLHDKELLKDVHDKSKHDEVKEKTLAPINTKEEQESKLNQLEKEIKLLKIKDGEIKSIEKNDDRSDPDLKVTVAYNIDKFKKEKRYYINSKEGYYDVELKNHTNLGTDPKEAAKEFASKISNPYKIIEKGKHKGQPWFILESDTYPPYMGWFPGLGGTDLYHKIDKNMKEQIKLQIEDGLERKKPEPDKRHLHLVQDPKVIQLRKPKEKAAFIKKVIAKLSL